MNKWLRGFLTIALGAIGIGEILAQQESPITVKVLYDNYTSEKGLTADWGFSCLVTVTKPMEIGKEVFVIGPTGDKIVEQALAVNTGKGLVIITGCSHPGVIEIAKRAKEQLSRDIYMICGGMHLLQMSEAQTRDVVRELKNLGIQKIGPTHCTGAKAIGLFKEACGDGFVELGVGRVLQFGTTRTYTNPVGETPIHLGDPFVLQHGVSKYAGGDVAELDSQPRQLAVESPLP